MSRPTKYDADVIRLHGMGWRQTEIAMELGTTRTNVYRIVSKLGLPRHDKRSERDEQIVSLYTQGWSQRQIERTVKTSIRTIKNVLSLAEVHKRPAQKRSRFSRDDIDRMIELTRQGVRQVDIAKEFGTCAGWVSTLLKHEPIFTQPSEEMVSDPKAKQ